MGSKFKDLVRARMAKTNEGWETAVRHVRAQTQAVGGQGGGGQQQPPARPPIEALMEQPPGRRSADELLALLHTTSTFAVLVGRIPAAAGGANLALVMKQVDDLARNPKYYAKTGGVDMTVSLDEHNALIAAGAIDDRKGQIIRSHRFAAGEPFQRLTFSDQCKECRRWIWCGEADRESKCICGHTYRVSFDLVAELVWGKKQHQHCMDCGADFAMHPVSEGNSPWHPVSMWQLQCDNCRRSATPNSGARQTATTDGHRMDRDDIDETVRLLEQQATLLGARSEARAAVIAELQALLPRLSEKVNPPRTRPVSFTRSSSAPRGRPERDRYRALMGRVYDALEKLNAPFSEPAEPWDSDSVGP